MSDSRYSLRDVRDDDHRWLVELHNDPDVLYNLTDPKPITLESHLAWWKSLNQNSQIRKVFCVDDERAGFTKFYNIDRTNRNCVLGADLHREFRGRGLARHMWTLMLHVCFEDLKLHRVSLTTAEYNARARHVYSTLGFLQEGRMIASLHRDEKYYDQICMYLLRNRD
ncbi:MAG: GNAT family protein [Vicinamibacterales bacterium]